MPKPKPTTASTIPIHCSYARLADVKRWENLTSKQAVICNE
jgi:hypothetical protein